MVVVGPSRSRPSRGFTLIELLVVVAIVALLMGVLLPSLAAARRSGWSVACLSNLRQMGVVLSAYAIDNDNFGPAIGEPYLAPPNWALVVQQGAGRDGSTPGTLYAKESILVCPASLAFHGRDMTRTYAMNATGHSGLPGDKDSFDDPAHPAHIRFDRVTRPSETPLTLDSAIAATTTNGPPATRTASVLDFRQSVHVIERVGRFHHNAAAFNTLRFDGSAADARDVAEHWKHPLP